MLERFRKRKNNNLDGNKDEANKLYKQAVVLRDNGLVILRDGDFEGGRKLLNEAMRLLREQEKICREITDKRGLADSLDIQADATAALGDLKESLNIHRKVEKICREINYKKRLASTLGDIGELQHMNLNFDKAMESFEEQEKICREINNNEGLATSLFNQGSLLSRFDRSESLFLIDEAMAIAKKNELKHLVDHFSYGRKILGFE
ncbi:MAG: hypothetical protein FWH29_06255 [Methanobrevibacter sp.]|nr:hypothetical protein [Methanobrevibacter sp.]